jgi:hypothetical protein
LMPKNDIADRRRTHRHDSHPSLQPKLVRITLPAPRFYHAEAISALSRKWHKRCLRCAGCGTTLMPNRLEDFSPGAEKNDIADRRRTHRHDSHPSLQPKLVRISALSRKWHKRCLRCAGCGTTLMPNRLEERDGEPWCRTFAQADFSPGAEKNDIADRRRTHRHDSHPSLQPKAISALSRKWHKRCLRCAGCGTTLMPNRLEERDGAGRGRARGEAKCWRYWRWAEREGVLKRRWCVNGPLGSYQGNSSSTQLDSNRDRLRGSGNAPPPAPE